jgi:hypothetical protein
LALDRRTRNGKYRSGGGEENSEKSHHDGAFVNKIALRGCWLEQLGKATIGRSCALIDD